jgi:tetratricopeptide (TPR) repeat protein
VPQDDRLGADVGRRARRQPAAGGEAAAVHADAAPREQPAMKIARLLLVGLLAVSLAARGQVLEDVVVRREGADRAVIEIHLGLRIQYLRSASNAKGNLTQIFFRLLENEDEGRTISEFRRPPTNGLVPRFSVSYPPLPGELTRRLDIEFESPVKATVRMGPDSRTLWIELHALTPAPKPPQAAAAAPAPAAPPPAQPQDPELLAMYAKADRQLADARAALDAGRLDDAVTRLNDLLNLPPNPSSREAQELIGVARERRGEADKARVEYELFLKLYPQGADAERVRKRLAALGAAAAAPGEAATGQKAAPGAMRAAAWGSFSQYYYGGKSDSSTQVTTITPATNATTIDTQKLSATDQKALVSYLDLNGRYSGNDWDNRLVVRDTQTTSFLASQPNRNILNALYLESRYLPGRGILRLGRQTSTIGGILGRFDGLVAGYGFTPRLRANAIVGRPVDTATPEDPYFYGFSLDVDSVGGPWSGNFYAIQQRVIGTTDRTSIGSELRYFDERHSFVSLVDYDTSFRAFNIGMVQGSWQLPSGTTLNLLGDYRRTPSLQLSNALLTGQNLTLQQYLDTFGEDGTRALAKEATPVSKVAYLGFTHPFAKSWQVGADVRYSSLSGVPEIGVASAIAGTGDVWTYSAQLIGSGLVGTSDVFVANASYLRSQTQAAESIGLTERFQWGEPWIFEPSYRYYRQRDNASSSHLTRSVPGLKVTYRIRERFALEAFATWEKSHTTSPTIDDNTTRRFFYLGYRWDF